MTWHGIPYGTRNASQTDLNHTLVVVFVNEMWSTADLLDVKYEFRQVSDNTFVINREEISGTTQVSLRQHLNE